MALSRPTRPSRTNTQKRCPFHYRGLECKSRKSRNTWHNGKFWPWSTEWRKAKVNRVLPRECTVRANTLFQQHKRRLYTWTSPDIWPIWIDYILHYLYYTHLYYKNWIFFAVKDGQTLYSQQKQDWELTVAQIMNSLLPYSDLNYRN